MREGEKAMRIYNLLREAHRSIKQIWREFPELNSSIGEGFSENPQWKTAVDAVDNRLYLAERFFVRAENEAKSPRKRALRKAKRAA